MQYLCLVYADEARVNGMSQQEIDALIDETAANNEELGASGQLVLAQALEQVDEAMTVRVRDGRLSVTDGPFAETNEQLGGFVLIEARDLNEALQIAGRIPSARLGSVEVRPVIDLTRERSAP
ncbi:MAG TPA: YciI family protein [Actinomycetes bacterium]|nr:YciI family protein [Actinomycetes bacterium]